MSTGLTLPNQARSNANSVGMTCMERIVKTRKPILKMVPAILNSTRHAMYWKQRFAIDKSMAFDARLLTSCPLF